MTELVPVTPAQSLLLSLFPGADLLGRKRRGDTFMNCPVCGASVHGTHFLKTRKNLTCSVPCRHKLRVFRQRQRRHAAWVAMLAAAGNTPHPFCKPPASPAEWASRVQ